MDDAGIGEFADRRGVPWALPSPQGEQTVDQGRGEAPDQHGPDAERRAGAPAWMAEHHPVGRVGEGGHGDPLHRGYLSDIHRPHRAGPAPPGEHRHDTEPAAHDEQLGQRAEHLHAGRVQPGLLDGLPERGGDGAVIAVVDRAAGEGGLAGVPPQPLAALDEQQVGAVGPLPEEDEHGGSAAPVCGRAQGARHVHRGRGGGEIPQPGRQVTVRRLPARRRHENGPALTSFAAVAASVGPSPNDGHQSATGHTPQAGLREWQTRRPCQISRCESITHSDFGKSAPTSASTFTGSSLDVQRSRRASRPKWVSTVIPGMPYALPSTTFAVLRPTPGSVTISSRVRGTSPPNRSRSAAASPITDLVFARKNPVGLRISSTSAGFAAARSSGAGYLANNAGVIMFTRLSVVCADSTVATKSWKGFSKSSSQCASGYVSASTRLIFRARRTSAVRVSGFAVLTAMRLSVRRGQR